MAEGTWPEDNAQEELTRCYQKLADLQSENARLTAQVETLTRERLPEGELQIITDAANLCAAEANRWRTNSDPRTYLHWEQVAGLLRAQCVAAKVAVDRMLEMEQQLATGEREQTITITGRKPMSEHCPGCCGYLPRSEGPKVEDILGTRPCPGLPSPAMQAVVEALFAHRAAKVHLQSLGEPVSPVEDWEPILQACNALMDAWDQVENALDALAALDRKEQP